MSSLGLFLVGSGVTALVAAAIVLLVWGAILDGRYAEEQRAESRARATGAQYRDLEAPVLEGP